MNNILRAVILKYADPIAHFQRGDLEELQTES